MSKKHYSYPTNASLPYINMKHIDGPFIYMRNGNIKWLSIKDRLFILLNKTDAYKLEKKYWNYIGLS